MDSIQLINTAIVKSKEKKIDCSYEQRLKKVCESPVMASLEKAIIHLSETQNISRDEAALQITEAVRELDKVWNDYMLMEGISQFKDNLRTH